MAILRNKKTGELKVVGNQELGGYKVPTPTPKMNMDEQTSSGSSAQLQNDWLGNLFRGNIIPSAVSAAGGTIGGLLGPLGGVAGAGAGYGGGEATRRTLANLLGIEGAKTNTDDPNQAKDLFQKPVEAAAFTGAGTVIGKLLNKGVIGILDDLLTKRLTKNPATSNVTQLADEFKSATKPYTESFTQGRDYQKMINSITAKLRSSAVGTESKAFHPSSGVPLQGLEGVEGATNVPILKINDWRKLSGRMSYGDDSAGKISSNLEKDLWKIFRKEIVDKEPTAKFILPAEATIKSFQDLATNLPFGLDRTAFGVSRLLGKIGKPVGKTAAAAVSPTIGNVPNPFSALLLYNLLRSGDNQE
jgi:hypothetical protein